VETASEVVNLVDDEEIEAIPELAHVPIRALEGGHGEWPQLAHTVAIATDNAPIEGADLAEPLMEEDPRRDKTQRRQPRLLHDSEGNPSLAAACRERDDTATMPQFPGGQRSLLVGSQADPQPSFRYVLGLVEEDVLKMCPGCEEPALEGRIAAGGTAMGVNAMVPENSGRLGQIEVRRRIGQQDGASVESQPHRPRAKGSRLSHSPVPWYRGHRVAPMPKDRYTAS